MSRCFPFPPPRYAARCESLIESIKLREEEEKMRKEKKRKEKIEKKKIKKEKKRAKEEKKEKRKEKKERKHKEGTNTATNGSDDDKKFKLINDIKETKAEEKLQKGEVGENELLERSGITEELEQPVTSRDPCCLSDSTQSSKRKRGSPQSTLENGPAIKIRLPLRKHSEPEELNSNSKFHVGSSSGNVEDIEDPLTNKTNLASERQSKCVSNTGPKRFLGKSDSSSCKGLQNSVSGNAAVTKSTVGSDRQSQCLSSTEPKRVVGNLDSRHGKSVQNSVRPDVVVAKTLGNDSQSQSLRMTECKRVLGNSVSRHGNAMQNSVNGDGVVVTKNIVGSERQSQSLRTAVPNGVLENSDGRPAKVMQNSVNGKVVVDKSTIGSDRQPQGVKLEEHKRVVSNSGKTIHNSIRGDSVDKGTLENDRQTQQCLRNAEHKRVHGNSDARHGKGVQNLVHGEAVVTKSTPGSDHQSKLLTKRKLVHDKHDSKHSKALQNLVHGDAVVTDKAVDAMDIDKAVGDAMGIVNAVDDGRKKVESLYKSLLLIPPLTYDGFESLDQDWLFSSEAETNRHVSKKQKCDSDVFKLSSSMWPRAEYFPEVDVYALPYAVPF